MSLMGPRSEKDHTLYSHLRLGFFENILFIYQNTMLSYSIFMYSNNFLFEKFRKHSRNRLDFPNDRS